MILFGFMVECEHAQLEESSSYSWVWGLAKVNHREEILGWLQCVEGEDGRRLGNDCWEGNRAGNDPKNEAVQLERQRLDSDLLVPTIF